MCVEILWVTPTVGVYRSPEGVCRGPVVNTHCSLHCPVGPQLPYIAVSDAHVWVTYHPRYISSYMYLMYPIAWAWWRGCVHGKSAIYALWTHCTVYVQCRVYSA